MEAIKHGLQAVIAWALQQRLVRAALLYSETNGALLAAAVTFRLLFSIFAGILLVFSIFAVRLASDPELTAQISKALDSAIPGIGGFLNLDAVQPATFTIAGIVSILGLLASALSAVANTRTAIQTLAGTAFQPAPFLLQQALNLLVAFGVAVLLLVSAATSFLGNTLVGDVLGWLGLSGSTWAAVGTWAVTVLSTFVLNLLVVVLLFRLLSGMRPTKSELFAGGAIGAIGLLVLQQLSGLFVGGATNNPLLAGFGSLIALLLWLNLSAQVVLVASAYIVVSVDERADRVAERYGATTLAEQKVRAAERRVRLASTALATAREAEGDTAAAGRTQSPAT